MWRAGQGLGLCGDWLNGATAEAAWLSGRALAQRIAAGWGGAGDAGTAAR